MKFTIETVSKLTGIPAASLRNWEKRYGFPEPDRSDGGHRFYTDSDIEFLRQALSLIESGHSLSELAKEYAVHKDHYNETHVEKKMISPLSRIQEIRSRNEFLNDVDYRVQLVYESLLKFDLAATNQHYAILSAQLSPEKLFDCVFEELLKKAGEDSYANEILVAQCQFVSSFVRLKLSSFMAFDFPKMQDQKILVCSLAEEVHEGALLLVAAHLKFKGYPVFYFGSNVCMKDLKAIIDEIQPDVLCISYTYEENLHRDIDDLIQLKTPICIGGRAVAQALQNLKTKKNKNLYFCQKVFGSEAAHYVELICQKK